MEFPFDNNFLDPPLPGTRFVETMQLQAIFVSRDDSADTFILIRMGAATRQPCRPPLRSHRRLKRNARTLLPSPRERAVEDRPTARLADCACPQENARISRNAAIFPRPRKIEVPCTHRAHPILELTITSTGIARNRYSITRERNRAPTRISSRKYFAGALYSLEI